MRLSLSRPAASAPPALPPARAPPGQIVSGLLRARYQLGLTQGHVDIPSCWGAHGSRGDQVVLPARKLHAHVCGITARVQRAGSPSRTSHPGPARPLISRRHIHLPHRAALSARRPEKTPASMMRPHGHHSPEEQALPASWAAHPSQPCVAPVCLRASFYPCATSRVRGMPQHTHGSRAGLLRPYCGRACRCRLRHYQGAAAAL